jgi:hypothetical protein
VFTWNPPAARSCLPAPLSQGGATDSLYVELYGTGIRGATPVQCFVSGPECSGAARRRVVGRGVGPGGYLHCEDARGAGYVRVYLVAKGAVSNVAGLNLQ